MRALVVVALLATPAHAIVDGTSSDSSSVVALVRADELVCSGSVIAPHAVLTAAHCVTADQLPTAIVAGELVAPVAKVVAPGFDLATLTDDVAILVFDRALAAPPLVVAPTLDHGIGDLMTLVGFGRTAPDDASPFVQRTGGALIAEIQDRAIVSHGPSFTCEGDSGGPALMDGRIVGITSSGDEACAEHSRHTRISAYVPFIEATVRATAPGGALAGDRCRYAANCAVGACTPALDEPRLSFCAPSCDAGCDALTCIDGLCRHAAPSPGSEGAFCHANEDCIDELCLAPDEDRSAICTRRCFTDLPGFDCPDGTACSVGNDGMEACFVPADNGISCGTGSPASLAVGLLVLAQLLRGRGKP